MLRPFALVLIYAILGVGEGSVRDDTPDDGDAAIAEGAVDVVDVPLFFVEQQDPGLAIF